MKMYTYCIARVSENLIANFEKSNLLKIYYVTKLSNQLLPTLVVILGL